MKGAKYFVMVEEADGDTQQYLIWARNRSHAELEARALVSEATSSGTLISVRPAADDDGIARRLLVVAGVTLAVSAPAIGAAMVIGLGLEGAL